MEDITGNQEQEKVEIIVDGMEQEVKKEVIDVQESVESLSNVLEEGITETPSDALETKNKETLRETIELKLSPRAYERVGNTTYTFEQTLSEFINNSIQAKIEGVQLKIEIDFFLDNITENCKTLIIKDNAKGIKNKDIGTSINLFDGEDKVDLNEHGIGMKASISSIGTLNFLKSRAIGENGFLIKELSPDLKIYDTDFDFEHGTIISISTSKEKGIVSITHRNKVLDLKKISRDLGAKYRRILSGKDVQIIVSIHSKGTKHQDVVEPVFPIYYNPFNTASGTPLIKNKIFVSNNVVAELTFGYAPKTEKDFEALGLDSKDFIRTQGRGISYKYALSQETQGLDLIAHDVVIEHHVIDVFSKSRHPSMNQFRGEIIFKSGVKTSGTKNHILRTNDVKNIWEQIYLFLRNGKLVDKSWDEFEYITEDMASDFANDYNRNLLSNDYLKLGQENFYEDEKAIKEKMIKSFKSPTSLYKDSKIIREFVIEEHGIKVDLLIDDIPWEIKKTKATSQDISQLLEYMIFLGVDSGYLIADSFHDRTYAYASMLNKNFNLKIELLKLEDLNL